MKEKLNIIGINSIARKNTEIILIDATIPNSFNISLSVKINVANPDAVVKFVKNIAFPTL